MVEANPPNADMFVFLYQRLHAQACARIVAGDTPQEDVYYIVVPVLSRAQWYYLEASKS